MQFFVGVLIGLFGGFCWSIGRSFKMVDQNQRRWTARYAPSVVSYIGWALICYGGLAIGGFSSVVTPISIAAFALLSFPLQIWGFRFATGMPYADWAAQNPEKAKSFQSKRPKVSQSESINLKEFRKGIQGRKYADLIRHHIGRQTTQQLHDGSLDTISFLPPTAQPLVENLIYASDHRALDAQFWKSDCATVFDGIIEDARNLLIEAQAPTDDETLFNMFQVVTLYFAHAASYQPRLRELMGIEMTNPGRQFASQSHP